MSQELTWSQQSWTRGRCLLGPELLDSAIEVTARQYDIVAMDVLKVGGQAHIFIGRNAQNPFHAGPETLAAMVQTNEPAAPLAEGLH